MNDTLETYRAQVKTWLKDYVAEFGAEARRGLTEEQDLALGRRWQRIKADAGYAGIAWKKEYGGAGLSDLENVIFNEEEAKHGEPSPGHGCGECAAAAAAE